IGPTWASGDLGRKGATTERRFERTSDRESRSLGLPLRVRRLSLPLDLDGSDRRRASCLDPGVVTGALQRHRRRTFAADHATRPGAPGHPLDAVPGRWPGGADRGALGSVGSYRTYLI